MVNNVYTGVMSKNAPTSFSKTSDDKVYPNKYLSWLVELAHIAIWLLVKEGKNSIQDEIIIKYYSSFPHISQ